MTTPAITETPDSHELAKDAINYTLGRIRDDVNIQYHMGALTEAFEKLKAAHSALTGISEAAIETEVFSKNFTRKANAKKIDEIVDLIDSMDPSGDVSHLERIRAICRS